MVFSQPESSEKDWDVTIGFGAFHEPISPGLSETETQPIPYFDIYYKNSFFLNWDGLGAYLYRSQAEDPEDAFKISAIIDYDDGREEKDYKSYLEGMGNIESSMEGKLKAEGELGPTEFTFSVSKGLSSDGHNGIHSELQFNFDFPIGRRSIIEIGPFVHYADKDYMQSYYGVTEAQASASQFTEYTPSGGIDQVAVEIVYRSQLTEHWQLLGLLEYGVLMGDAKDSPITEKNNTLTAGFGLAYQF